MLRKHNRLRREYLYRKSQESTLHAKFDAKQKISTSIAKGKKIPTELRRAERDMRTEMEYDDTVNIVPSSHQDDEYSRAGVSDPRIMLTTSRDPSSRLKQFAKELCWFFPNSQRMNRGNHVLGDLIETARSNDITDLVVVHETRGEPDTLIISHLPYGPTAHFAVMNTVLRHDIGAKTTVPQVFPHLVFEGFKSKLGLRVTNVLKYMFPPARPDGKRIISFINDSDFIIVRHHLFVQEAGKAPKAENVELDELGPRFDLKPFLIQLGTLDVQHADVEYALRPYMNTAAYREQL